MWVLLVIVVVVVLWMVGAYNGLISLKNQTFNAFKQIDVQLKRRHDLIPNLVNAVKGAMDFEKSTLEAVIQARNQAVNCVSLISRSDLLPMPTRTTIRSRSSSEKGMPCIVSSRAG